MMYMHSPFGGMSSANGACSGMGSNRRPLSVIDVSILFSTSMFKDVLFLWPLHSKTKTSFSTRMHHCCSKTSTLVYIVQIWGSDTPPFTLICITPIGIKLSKCLDLAAIYTSNLSTNNYEGCLCSTYSWIWSPWCPWKTMCMCIVPRTILICGGYTCNTNSSIQMKMGSKPS